MPRAPAARRSITHSRSFGTPIAQRALLREALASFASRAAARARKYGLSAGALLTGKRLGVARPFLGIGIGLRRRCGWKAEA